MRHRYDGPVEWRTASHAGERATTVKVVPREGVWVLFGMRGTHFDLRDASRTATARDVDRAEVMAKRSFARGQG